MPCSDTSPCPSSFTCVRTRENHHHFVYVSVADASSSSLDDALFIGPLRNLLSSVELSSSYPRLSLFPVRLPLILDKLLRFLLSVSFSLALLNAAPVRALDGENLVTRSLGSLAASPVLAFGSSLLILNVGLSLAHLVSVAI
jgi:hypothetical protein